MTPRNELRLLPWSGPDGRPCYLSTDDEDSHLSRLANKVEALQLDLADNLVSHTLEVLGDETTELEELRRLSAELTNALKDTLRVATSRGHRLAALDLTARERDDEGPYLPAASFG
ncbi:hypothetical protein ACFT8P_02870 [Streptomyces sp. NPDC057101]|uniref:hypothetical protein n=1 Tax=Streptomyces sp. NPDC057101 TaxID=3346020 RepID=UPI0036335B40